MGDWWDFIDKLDSIWTILSLLVFMFAAGVRVAVKFNRSMRSMRREFSENVLKDKIQQKQINVLRTRVNELLETPGVKKIVVKRRLKDGNR